MNREEVEVTRELHKRAKTAESALAAALARSAELEADFATLVKWMREHLEAIEFDEDEEDPDVVQIVESLRFIARGDFGCTGEEDYKPEQWTVLTRIARAALSPPEDDPDIASWVHDMRKSQPRRPLPAAEKDDRISHPEDYMTASPPAEETTAA